MGSVAKLNIPKLVSNLTEKYNTRNPYELCKSLNIEIIEHDLKSAYGMYKLVKKNKFIFINNKLDDTTKNFVLAHELGHALLHKDSPGFYFKNHTLMKTSVYEIQANTFAAELIIPNNYFEEALSYGYTMSQLSSAFNVPEDLIKLKLENW